MKKKPAPYKTYFYRKILIWLFLGVFFLMLLVSFGTFYVYFRYYVNGLADSALQSTAYVRADLNTQLENVTLLTDNMYLETEIQEILSGPQGNNQARMQRYYSGQIAPNPYFMYQIDLFDLQGNRYIYANSATIAHSFLAGSFADEWGPRVEQAGGRILWVDGREISPGASHLLFALRLIKNTHSNQPVGMAVVSVMKRSISGNLSLYATDTTQISLAGPDGTLVLAEDLRRDPEQMQVLDMDLVSGEEGYYTSLASSTLVVYLLDEATPWYVVQTIRLPTFFMFLQQVLGAMPVLFVLVLVLAGLFVWSLYRALSRPILTLVESMRSLESLDFTPPQLDVARDDEIGYLNRGYLLMLGEMKRLFENLVQEQNAKKNYELEALRAQINPHFLYNTLTVVRFLIDMGQNQSASQVLISLIKLLKINLDPKREMLTVEEEMEYLRNYLSIQKHRYDNFEVKCSVDPGAMPCAIPRLLIQPLVENSLFHGLKNGALHGRIAIQVRREDGRLRVQVQDSGAGFPPGFDVRAARVNAQRSSASIGLHNVNERLRLYYGPDSQLHTENLPGTGCRVWFTIPVEEG